MLRRLPLALLPLAGLLAWQLIVWIAAPREWLLPSPADVAEVMWSDRERLWFHAQATIAEAAIGFALAAVLGMALAMAIAGSPAVGRAVYPWVVASQAIPILAVAPLVAIWLNYGTAQVMVAFVVAFFPVVVTGVDGLRGVDPAVGRAVRTLGREPLVDLSPRHAAGRAADALHGAPHVRGVRGDRRGRRRVRRGRPRARLPVGVLHGRVPHRPQLRGDRAARADRPRLLRGREPRRAHRAPAPPPFRPSDLETLMIRRRILLALAALLAVCGVVIAGCGGDDDEAAADAQPVSLILDWFPNVDHAGIYGGIDQGYFEDEGLAVTATVPSDPAASLKQVGAGRADFAISYEQEVLLARSEGVPVVAVGALITHPLNTVLVRTDRGVSTPRDLEGKTVGAAGVPSDRPLLESVVRSAGGDPSKVTVRNIGFTLGPALAAGRFDAVIGAYWNVEQIELERQGVDVEAFRLEENGVPDYDELVVVTSDETIRDRPEMVRSFLKGLRTGQDWAATDQAGAVEALLAANGDLDEETLAAQLDVTAEILSPSDEPTLTLDPAEWSRFADWMTENDLLRKPVDVDAAVTAEFLPDGS